VAEIAAIGIVKRYGGLVANDGVNFSAECGEIHGVMGENGAGKTTLMSILFGLQEPDAGEIRLRDAPVRFRSPIEAMRAGIGMVHQSFKLFDSLTVWENIIYGAEPARGLFIDRGTARRRVAELAERRRLAVDPDARVGDLSIGVRQRIEILKALYRDARILILDEPTAVLTPPERDALFAVLKNLAADERTILLVTHKLHEVTAITDRVTVLRDGRTVASLRTADTDAGEIVRAMTGRNVNLKVAKRAAQPGDAVLSADGVTIGPLPAVARSITSA
jgi:ABC-type uncharacterized transport system ATPase subunit